MNKSRGTGVQELGREQDTPRKLDITRDVVRKLTIKSRIKTGVIATSGCGGISDPPSSTP